MPPNQAMRTAFFTPGTRSIWLSSRTGSICVIDSREALVAELQRLGFEVLPSAANFVFARHPQQDAAALAAGLREQGVIVRHFKQARIAQFLRITIGAPEQNQALLDALGSLL